MNCKRLWLAAASAFAFVLNALLFCRKHPSKKKDSNGSLDPGQVREGLQDGSWG
jgi:hypothetical protein